MTISDAATAAPASDAGTNKRNQVASDGAPDQTERVSSGRPAASAPSAPAAAATAL
jgi:hypothetical protein